MTHEEISRDVQRRLREAMDVIAPVADQLRALGFDPKAEANHENGVVTLSLVVYVIPPEQRDGTAP